MSDRALLDALSDAGARDALQELFRRHGAAVHRLGGLLDPDSAEVDRMVEDVFVTLARRSGRLEDDVENVRLGLLAMALRRSRPPAQDGPQGSTGDALASRLQALPSADREAVALTVLAAASLSEVSVVLRSDPQAVGARLRAGLRCAAISG